MLKLLNKFLRVPYLVAAFTLIWFAAMADDIKWTLGLISIAFGIVVLVVDDYINPPSS